MKCRRFGGGCLGMRSHLGQLDRRARRHAAFLRDATLRADEEFVEMPAHPIAVLREAIEDLVPFQSAAVDHAINRPSTRRSRLK